jgi:hypothetical protein
MKDPKIEIQPVEEKVETKTEEDIEFLKSQVNDFIERVMEKYNEEIKEEEPVFDEYSLIL